MRYNRGWGAGYEKRSSVRKVRRIIRREDET